MLLRTVAPYSMPGSEMSSMYRARPVTLSRPSFRGADKPTMRSFFTSNSARTYGMQFDPKNVSGWQYCERKPEGFVYLISLGGRRYGDIPGRGSPGNLPSVKTSFPLR